MFKNKWVLIFTPVIALILGFCLMIKKIADIFNIDSLFDGFFDI